MKIAYGLKDFDGLMKSIAIARLNTGELIISYTRKIVEERAYVFVCPFQIKESVENQDDIYLIPFLPFFTDNTFKISEMDIQFCKNTVSDYVKGAYSRQAELLYRDILDELKTICDMNDKEYHNENVYVEKSLANEKGDIPAPSSPTVH